MFNKIRIYLLLFKKKWDADIVEIPEVLQPVRLPGLDGLRGIAILWVILGHAVMGTPAVNSIVGGLGVSVFFVISGFLITTLLLKEKITTGKISLKKFYLRRLLRIYPVLILYLVVLLILNTALHLNIGVKSFISAALMVQNLPRLSTYNWHLQHFWSLSVEEQYYLVFPGILALSLRMAKTIMLAIVITVPIISLLGFNKIGVFYSNHTIHIFAFIIINLLGSTVNILVGALFAILLFKKIISISNRNTIKYTSLIIFVTALLTSTKASFAFIPYSNVLLFPILIALVIVFNLSSQSFFNKFLDSRILVYTGAISYSLYVWQQLFSNPDNTLLHNQSIWVNFLVIFMVANVSYYFYEKRFLLLKSRFKVK